MKDGVTFNGAHCSSVGLTVMSTKRPLLPEIKDEYIEIPQKSGSILIPDKSAKDIMVEVEFLLETTGSFFVAARNVGQWLWTDARKRLIFDDDPSYFYNAKVTGNIDMERIASLGQFTVQFRCEPYPREV